MRNFEEFLADPFGRTKHDGSIRIPNKGDKIKIKDSFLKSNKHGFTNSEVVDLSRQQFQMIEDVSPISVGKNGDYKYRYSCYLKGYDFMINDWNFDFID